MNRRNSNVGNPVGCLVDFEVMAPRQQEATFQVLDRGMESGTAAFVFTTGSIEDILCRHGPSWANRPAQTVISNALQPAA